MAELSEMLKDDCFRRDWYDAMRADAQYSDMLDRLDEDEDGDNEW